MFGNLDFSSGGAVREELADVFGKLLHIGVVQFRCSFSLTLRTTLSGLCIRQAFGFRLGQRVLLDEKSLTLISSSSLAEF
jgi:hypothetical protein